MTDYGYFDGTSREYVVTNPKTPVRWINYVGNLEFGGFVRFLRLRLAHFFWHFFR